MIVGTAGHIDHGKSALVRALTGIDTDRLKEEKARGISIDLGFAYIPCENGETIGFVDAPGHSRFIRNMIAGATGIDALMLVVAADDGVMPQTREHLAIADLLGVKEGVVALTKTDLVPDDWRAAMIGEVRDVLAPTAFASAPILPVSTQTGEGVEAVRAALQNLAAHGAPRAAQGRFRLAVDRCFTISGVGTVVTGPVMSGSVSVGDRVTVSPQGFSARVRSIHAQNRPAETGRCGERCALNLTGDAISRDAIARGDVVLDPLLHAPSDRIDCRLNLLDNEPRSLKHWTPARVHHGAAEASARVALLQEEPIAPGGEGRVQLVLDRPIAAGAGDFFILRDTSGARTMGGGRFVDLRAPQRRRKTPERLAKLDALERADPVDRLSALMACKPFYVVRTVFARDHALSEEALDKALENLSHVSIGQGAETILISKKTWGSLRDSARRALEAFHENNPGEKGVTAKRLAEMLEPRMPAPVAASVIDALAEEGVLSLHGGALRLPDHKLKLGGRDAALRARMLPHLKGAERFRPPRVNEMAELLHLKEDDARRVLKTMARQGEAVEIVADHFFLREAVDEVAVIIEEIARTAPDGFFAAAALRDRLENGRKLSIQILDYFDRQGVTLRRGDLRHIDSQRLQRFVGDARLAGAAS
ncbi:selenocysteine-specific translation elongation factor [Hyphococcus luteus]|uniref:Selenocysteine-specific elongation factor n=1 Tax=Hyphococcus luteus TaxID=2058213 RepID=A0A2S7KAL0_9PROT|nr:selenocysteine-specific translation elongation factor [Marinicaulis flavus]PQA89535.1 selenocysteine-specific translation elongation factor [Marinicaulis flavus]